MTVVKYHRPTTLDEALESVKEMLYESVTGVSMAGPTAARCSQIVKCIDQIVDLEVKLKGRDPLSRMSDEELLELMSKAQNNLLKLPQRGVYEYTSSES